MATTVVLCGIDELRAAAGRRLGTSDWVEVTQERVDTFADATGAGRLGGGPVAPSYLTLSAARARLAGMADTHHCPFCELIFVTVSELQMHIAIDHPDREVPDREY